MNRKDNLNHENKVLSFLTNTEKKIIIKLKYTNVSTWIRNYLETLPQYETKLLVNNNQPEMPCEYWITDLLNNVDEHCKHCTSYKNGRDFSNSKTTCSECLQNYRSFIEYFCNHCTKKTNSRKCTKTVSGLIKKKLKSNFNKYLEPKASMLFSIYTKFTPDKNDMKYFNFDLFKVTLKFTEAETTENIINQKINFEKKLKAFISRWIEVPEQISPKKIFEIAFHIIAIHYLFLNDILNRTTLSNSPKSALNIFINDDYENANLLAAYLMILENYKNTEIESIISQNINEDQIVNLQPINNNIIPKFNKKQILFLIKKINEIYSYPVLEKVKLSDLPKEQINIIRKQIKNGRLSPTKVKITNNAAQIDNALDTRYVAYIILVKFLCFIESIKRTRFTNKLPTLFRDDNLIKLRNQMISDELDKKNLTMKQACKNLGLNYKTTHMALDSKLIYHPKYRELRKKPDYPDPVYNNYNKFTWVFENSSIEDLEEWIKNVRKLKK